MKPKAKIVLVGALPVILTALGGCADTRWLWENLYEGIQMRNRQEKPPAVEPTEPTPSYDEYLRQRREVIHEPESLTVSPLPRPVPPAPPGR